jgi:hypothetical protein
VPDCSIPLAGRSFLRAGTDLLDAGAISTEYLSIPDMLKATPSQEGGERFLYMEASNESTDLQSERVLVKALSDSASYFDRYGNIDIQHRSMIGLANGDPNYHLHEIGRPEKVRIDGTRTFVKAQIFQGDTPVADAANNFWDSITKLRPPTRWYPSIGGKIEGSERQTDPLTKAVHRVITKVMWANIGLSRTPVNPKVDTVSTVPFGILAKCWGTAGLDLTKAMEAGYGTDSATLTGGGALRKQSLDHKPQTYWDMREKLAKALRGGRISAQPEAMARHLSESYGVAPAEAAEHVERFLTDLNKGTPRT